MKECCTIHMGDCTSCKYFITHSGCNENSDCKTCDNFDKEADKCRCLMDADSNNDTCPYYKKEE